MEHSVSKTFSLSRQQRFKPVGQDVDDIPAKGRHAKKQMESGLPPYDVRNLLMDTIYLADTLSSQVAGLQESLARMGVSIGVCPAQQLHLSCISPRKDCGQPRLLYSGNAQKTTHFVYRIGILHACVAWAVEMYVVLVPRLA